MEQEKTVERGGGVKGVEGCFDRKAEEREKITRDVEREGKEKRVNKSNRKLPLTAADFL